MAARSRLVIIAVVLSITSICHAETPGKVKLNAVEEVAKPHWGSRVCLRW